MFTRRGRADADVSDKKKGRLIGPYARKQTNLNP